MASYDGSLEAVDCHTHSVRYDMVIESRADGRLSCLTQVPYSNLRLRPSPTFARMLQHHGFHFLVLISVRNILPTKRTFKNHFFRINFAVAALSANKATTTKESTDRPVIHMFYCFKTYGAITRVFRRMQFVLKTDSCRYTLRF